VAAAISFSSELFITILRILFIKQLNTIIVSIQSKY